MNIRKVVLIVFAASLLTIAGTSAQQRKKQEGEPVSASFHQKARAIAANFWASRVIKCSSDVWYTLHASERGTMNVYELSGTITATYVPTMNWRSELDVKNKIEGTGVINANQVIMREFNSGRGSFTEYKNGSLPTMRLQVVDGSVVLSELDPSNIFWVRLNDNWHRPYSCEDVASYIVSKEFMLAKTFVCLKNNGSNCDNRPPEIDRVGESNLIDRRISPNMSSYLAKSKSLSKEPESKPKTRSQEIEESNKRISEEFLRGTRKALGLDEKKKP